MAWERRLHQFAVCSFKITALRVSCPISSILSMIYGKLLEQYTSNKKAYQKTLKSVKKVSGGQLDEAFHEHHDQVFQEIDCLKCANCCKTISPIFKNKDIERIAKSLKMRPTAFIEEYLYIDQDGDYVLKETPCAFLGHDNYCGIYEVRPKACSEFPHTNHKNMQKHLFLAKKNLEVCPAVVEIVKKINSNI